MKHIKHIPQNGGEFNGDESHGIIRKKTQKQTNPSHCSFAKQKLCLDVPGI